MKKYNFLIYIIIAIIIVILIVFFVNRNNNKNKNNESSNSNLQSNIVSERTSINVNQEMAENRIANIIENKNEILNNIAMNETNSSISNNTPISSYSTQIKDQSEGRLTNINITCSTLSGSIVHPGETFSFNKVVGQPTSERGYQEASIIVNHKTEKGVGGGNCQVSSTLYNAVLDVGNLAVIERHEHGKDVTYVPDGRDAAVSYGSLDFKFRNDLSYDIRIEAATDNNTLTISLYKN